MTGLRSTLVKFTVFAIVSVILFGGLYRMMSNTVSGESHTWQARFVGVSGLRTGDDVRVAGVKVGRVEAIEVVDNAQAQVTFTLRRDQEVYEGTRLTLRYQNLLGQRYLALQALDRRGDRLRPGDVLPTSMTSAGFDLTALLNGFEPLFAVIDPKDVNELATNIVAVLQGESGTIESLLQHTAEATTYLADREQVFDEVLGNLTPVLRNLDEQSGEFDATVVQFRKLMQGLAGEKDSFADTIDHLGSLVDSTSSLLAELRPPLRDDVDALRRTTALVVRERPRVARALADLHVVLDTFARTMSYGAWLNVYFCNLAFRAAGAPVWLGGDGGPHSGACR